LFPSDKSNDTSTDNDDDDDLGNGQHNGTDVPWRAADYTWTGNLRDGEDIPIQWADDGAMACWPGNENVNFNGFHIAYEHTQPIDTHLYIRMTPEKDVDLNLYTIVLNNADQGIWPPEIFGAITCDASYDAPGDNNPGVSEALFQFGWTVPYRVVIAVAGANHTEEGEFKIEVWEEYRWQED